MYVNTGCCDGMAGLIPGMGFAATPADSSGGATAVYSPAQTITELCANSDVATCQAAINYYAQTGTPAPASSTATILPGVSNTVLVAIAAVFMLVVATQR